MNMKNLLILGAGQYGQAVKELAQATGRYKRIEFLDDNSKLAVGKLWEIQTREYDEAIVAMGNPAIRRQWLEKIDRRATLIHPAAIVMPSATVGAGCVIEVGAVISSNAEIGEGTIVMANAVVGHDAKVGGYCQLKYNSTIPERAAVPNASKVDCNGVYCGEEKIQEKISKFIEEEREKNGVEPSFF